MLHLIVIILIALSKFTVSDDAAAAATATSAASAPASPPLSHPPSGLPGGGFGGLPGGGFGGGFGGLPGGLPLFPGFFKNFDFNAGAGFGPLGGLPGLLGGGGGVPPGLLDDGAGLEGGSPYGGFVGPSYIPSTWIGQALGAKGDLLFPIVIFVFFVVGVFTVIQLLLAFIVPLIAKKFAIKSAFLPLLHKREAADSTSNPDLDFITNSVLEALNKSYCSEYVACHSGNFLHSMAGGDSAVQEYEGILKSLSTMTHSKTLTVFKDAFVSGAMNCAKFTCGGNETVDQQEPSKHANSSTNANEIH